MASESKTVPVHVAAQMVPIKLTEDNYFLWKSLVVPVLKQYDMFNVVQGRDQQSPPLSVKDQNCLNFIKLTMSVSMLPHAVGCSTARALWLTLEEQGNKMAQSRLEKMSRDLQTLKKGSFMSMRSYYESARTIANRLASAGSPVSDRDFVKYLLRGFQLIMVPLLTRSELDMMV